ncbi:hypothetical protein BVRB_6g136020 [Beta vulgaris subsp. vulgaris]|nr:hypothetical protein BVRB_6g136020 [Beta vulgaris subsp. vulgaris]
MTNQATRYQGYHEKTQVIKHPLKAKALKTRVIRKGSIQSGEINFISTTKQKAFLSS